MIGQTAKFLVSPSQIGFFNPQAASSHGHRKKQYTVAISSTDAEARSLAKEI